MEVLLTLFLAATVMALKNYAVLTAIVVIYLIVRRRNRGQRIDHGST
jgi:hypothetical protein